MADQTPANCGYELRILTSLCTEGGQSGVEIAGKLQLTPANANCRLGLRRLKER